MLQAALATDARCPEYLIFGSRLIEPLVRCQSVRPREIASAGPLLVLGRYPHHRRACPSRHRP
jgi:hypothetical protein